jgi:hypothetical protein
MRKLIMLFGLVIIVALGIIFLGDGKGVDVPSGGGDAKAYINLKYGFSFAHPADYFVIEMNRGTAERDHYQIVLLADTKENHDVVEGRTTGRDGPVAITFDLYQNNLDKQTPESWIKGESSSNYKLSSDGKIEETLVDEAPALKYHWSGLYEADNVVFEHGGYIVSVVVMYITPDDPIRKDFGIILDSVKLSNFSKGEAVSLLQARYPELKKYSTQSLPPTRIKTLEASTTGGWYVSFEERGSGVDQLLGALCYLVSGNRQVKKIGEYAYVPTSSFVTKSVDPTTCKGR